MVTDFSPPSYLLTTTGFRLEIVYGLPCFATKVAEIQRGRVAGNGDPVQRCATLREATTGVTQRMTVEHDDRPRDPILNGEPACRLEGRTPLD
jgi:hypothetical protein